MVKRVGICTGGGDCPGLNATIRALVKYGMGQNNWEMVGILNSFHGLLAPSKESTIPLTLDHVTEILDRGGTILGTYNKNVPELKRESLEHIPELKKNMEKLQLDSLIVIGGEGSQGIAKGLWEGGLNIIGIPKTIDNDLPGTEQTIGFSSCLDVVTDGVGRLQSTAESHDRVMVIEVMGRDTGYIALHGGLAGGAHVILIPEIPFDIDQVTKKLYERKKMGRNFSIIVVSEGAFQKGSAPVYTQVSSKKKNLGGIGQLVAQEVAQKTHWDTRVTVLGHLQRGGAPNPTDKILATKLAICAIDLVQAKNFGQLVVVQGGKITHMPYSSLQVGQRRKIPLDDPSIRAAELTGISLGRAPQS